MGECTWIKHGAESTFSLQAAYGKAQSLYLNPPKNTPSIAAGLDGDEFGIVGEAPTINSDYYVHQLDVKYSGDSPKGLQIPILPD